MSTPNPYQQGPLNPSDATTGQFPQTPATSPEPKKKGGCLKWGGVVVGAFVVLGIITNIAGGNEEEPSASATPTVTTTATSSPSETTAPPATRAADAPDPTTPPMVTPPIDSAEEDSPETFPEAAADSERVPAEFASALSKADSYANGMHMSKQGVYDQLVSEYGEGFSAEAAQYAIDNVQADWNTNALETAHDYQDMNMSPAAIHDQLTSTYGEEFTQAQADYALANLNGGAATGGATGEAQGGVPTEFTSALATADSYANGMHMSRQGVYDQLVSDYGEQFTPEAAQYAIDNVQADWNTNALETARSYQDMNMSPAAIHDQLTSTYGEKFTQAQADYAIANL